jgi:hypothetical protein
VAGERANPLEECINIYTSTLTASSPSFPSSDVNHSSRIDFPKAESAGNRNFRIVENSDGELIWLEVPETIDSDEENHGHPAENEELSLPETLCRHEIDTRPARVRNNFPLEPAIPKRSLHDVQCVIPSNNNESSRDCNASSYSKRLNKGYDYHSFGNSRRLEKGVYNIGVVGSNGIQPP